MSLSEADVKFPGQTGFGLPPPATAENPGRVYPKSDPKARGGFHEFAPNNRQEDYHLWQNIFENLDRSLGDVIAAVEDKSPRAGNSGGEDDLLLKFRGWKRELDAIRAEAPIWGSHGMHTSEGVPAERGGMFVE